jgi:hypothetical protein
MAASPATCHARRRHGSPPGGSYTYAQLCNAPAAASSCPSLLKVQLGVEPSGAGPRGPPSVCGSEEAAWAPSNSSGTGRRHQHGCLEGPASDTARPPSSRGAFPTGPSHRWPRTCKAAWQKKRRRRGAVAQKATSVSEASQCRSSWSKSHSKQACTTRERRARARSGTLGGAAVGGRTCLNVGHTLPATVRASSKDVGP